MEKSEFEYNNLIKIDHLRHEVITDKSLSYHDALFKIIIIGDSGKFYSQREEESLLKSILNFPNQTKARLIA